MQFKKEEIRERILRAAESEFHRKGFNQSSMRHIARDAGVSVSNVYNYFSDKEELFDEIINSFYHYFSQLVRDLTRDASEEDLSAENVSSIIRFVGDLVKKNRIELEMLLDGSRGTQYESFKHELIHIFEEHFRDHMGAQQREGGNLFIFHLIASHLIESLLEISRHYVDDEWVDGNIELLVRYHLFGITRVFE